MRDPSKKTRLVKRYPNRKLYDTLSSRYVTLDDIAVMIREGDDIQVVDHRTHDDLTSVTLTQIIFEQEKQKKSLLPLSTLRNIIQSGGEKIVSTITHAREEAGKRFKTAIESVSHLPMVQAEIRSLRKKIDELEDKLRKYER